jgi:hypothetical protein
MIMDLEKDKQGSHSVTAPILAATCSGAYHAGYQNIRDQSSFLPQLIWIPASTTASILAAPAIATTELYSHDSCCYQHTSTTY